MIVFQKKSAPHRKTKKVKGVRLDEDDEAKLAAISKRVRLNPSEIIRQLINQAHDEVVVPRKRRDADGEGKVS